MFFKKTQNSQKNIDKTNLIYSNKVRLFHKELRYKAQKKRIATLAILFLKWCK